MKTGTPVVKCKGCGADIIWIKTKKDKPQPLDVKPEKRVIIRLDDNGKPRGEVWDTWMPHHATCPDVEKFRKK